MIYPLSSDLIKFISPVADNAEVFAVAGLLTLIIAWTRVSHDR
jgi:hypothetical protein